MISTDQAKNRESGSGRRALWTGVLLVAMAALGAIVANAYPLGLSSAPVASRALQPPPLPLAGRPGADPSLGELLSVPEATAREINRSRPFSREPIVPAMRFVTTLMGPDLEQAVDCLSIAGLYEAGGAASDQKAVMQVVLNRVRHPAFPKSICGVVFQGYERDTGCQFSFTCDGSMRRWQPSAPAVRRARSLALEMLNGAVDKRVGVATHYHTDWVVPYWSASLVKLSAVKSHLFFRWPGFWGTNAAFRERAAAREPAIAKLDSDGRVLLLASVRTDEDATEAPAGLALADGEAPEELASPSAPSRLTPKKLELAYGSPPGKWALEALRLCGSLPECRVIGWTDPANAAPGLGTEALVRSPPDFLYVQELRNRLQVAYWDCGRWARAATSRCLGPPEEIARLATGG